MRRALQKRSSRTSIARIAARYGFTHFGRFSGQYRRAFDELPSATRRRAAVPQSNVVSKVIPSSRSGRPAITISPFTAPAALRGLAELRRESIAAAISAEGGVSVALPRGTPDRWREIGSRYDIHGRVAQVGEQLRVAATLVDIIDGVELWGDAWPGHIANPFATLDRVAVGVAHAVSWRVRQADLRRVGRRRVQDHEACELCLRAYPLHRASGIWCIQS